MAQTQKYEKVVILNSSLDKDIFEENSSTNFSNQIYPISQFQKYDSVVPMMTSIPIIKIPPEPPDPDPPIKLYRLNQLGKELFNNKNYLLENCVKALKIKAKGEGLESELRCFVGIELINNINISNHVFELKQNIDKFFTPVVFFRFYKKEFFAAQNDMVFLGGLTCNPIISSLKAEYIKFNNHSGWDIQTNQILQWNFSNSFNDRIGGLFVGTVQLEMDEINFFKPSNWNNTTLTVALPNENPEISPWTPEDTIEFRRLLNEEPIKLNFYKLTLHDDYQITFPTDIWEEINFTPNCYSEIGDDNQQIYVHNNNIELNRIANQNEPIFQDLFLSKNGIASNRLTDYISIPNSIPLTLNNSLISEMGFQFLNAIGVENQVIDLERSTIVLCKLIKKYYNFSDGKKKTYITDVLTY